MPTLSIFSQFQMFTDIDGDPLDSGYIYIGTAGLNPETNPIQVYWDVALTIPAAQPIRTINGYPSNSGTAARLFVNADDCSIITRNKNGTLVFSTLNQTDRFTSSWVYFVQSGTGAVSRTVQDKLRESMSVKDFGATGDGVTDDSLALEACRVAALAAGKAIYMPAGTYCFNEATVRAAPAGFGWYFPSSDGQEIFGDGIGRTILKNVSATGALLRCASGYMNVHDLTIDNNNSTGSAYRHGGQYSTASNLVIKNQAGTNYACILDGSTLSSLNNVYLFNCTRGISIGATTPTQYIRFNHIQVEVAQDGIAIDARNSSQLVFNELYIELVNGVTQINQLVYMEGINEAEFYGFSCEIWGALSNANQAWIEIKNSLSINFFGGSIYESLATSANTVIIMHTGTTNSNINFNGINFRSTSANMTMINNSGTLYNLNIENIRTFNSAAFNGLKCDTAISKNLILANWIDSSAACTHTIQAVAALVSNVNATFVVSNFADNVFVNCTGSFSGTGANTLLKLPFPTGTIDPASIAMTFTTPGNLAVTYSLRDITYTRFGNRYNVRGKISASAFTHTTAAGQFRITGALPVAPAKEVLGCAGADGFSGLSGALYAYAQVGQTYVDLYYSATGTLSGAAAGNAPTGSAKSVWFEFSFEI